MRSPIGSRLIILLSYTRAKSVRYPSVAKFLGVRLCPTKTSACSTRDLACAVMNATRQQQRCDTQQQAPVLPFLFCFFRAKLLVTILRLQKDEPVLSRAVCPENVSAVLEADILLPYFRTRNACCAVTSLRVLLGFTADGEHVAICCGPPANPSRLELRRVRLQWPGLSRPSEVQTTPPPCYCPSRCTAVVASPGSICCGS